MAGRIDHGSDRAPNYDAQFKVAPFQTDLQFAFEVPLASVLNSIADFAIRIRVPGRDVTRRSANLTNLRVSIDVRSRLNAPA